MRRARIDGVVDFSQARPGNLEWERYLLSALLALENKLLAESHRTRFFDFALQRSTVGVTPAVFQAVADRAHQHMMAYLRLTMPWMVGTDEELSAATIAEMKAKYEAQFGAWDDERNNRLVDSVTGYLRRADSRQRRHPRRSNRKG